jgi:Nucleotidyltransferase domain
MHIYVFGSVCRGEIDHGSDVDLIALTTEFDPRFDPSIYSIYSYKRLKELWQEGNPFAWHLAIESKMVFSSDGNDFIKSLCMPASYNNIKLDCLKFYNLYLTAASSIISGCNSIVFELSTIFLAIRNYATCYSLGRLNIRDFSRYSAQRLGDDSLPLPQECFSIFERCRILSTRGTGTMITAEEISIAVGNLTAIRQWMEFLLSKGTL